MCQKRTLSRLKHQILPPHKKTINRDFLEIPWLRLHAPNPGGPSWIPGQGTRSCKPKLKIPHATTKTQHSYINKYFQKRKQQTRQPMQRENLSMVSLYATSLGVLADHQWANN